MKPLIADVTLASGEGDIDASALYGQVVIDKARLAGIICHALQTRAQVNLVELCRLQPLRHGLAELVAYLQLASDGFKALVDEDVIDTVGWVRAGPTGAPQTMRAQIPRVIYLA